MEQDYGVSLKAFLKFEQGGRAFELLSLHCFMKQHAGSGRQPVEAAVLRIADCLLRTALLIDYSRLP
ncbi:hypothetical protein [Caballeronia sp. LZ035]|uniref:hypothetical protein n=1 Tax=Caballeronia sp. LZ035 TaxID=3038568 RepID=UPI002854C6BE|nr:hypothetical protein [Caballeronia sp. LZ035]MDR5756114.1 hypothetical protein [Caballeronia sp. LZ035]